MDSFYDDGEEFRYFDALEEVSSSCSGSDILESSDTFSGLSNCASSSFHYDVWVRSPKSTQERRSKFLDWMESGLDDSVEEFETREGEINRTRDCIKAVQGATGFRDESCSRHSSVSIEATGVPEGLYLKEGFQRGNGYLGADKECVADDLRQHSKLSSYQEMNSGQLSTSDESGNPTGSSTFHQLVQRETQKTRSFKRKLSGIKNGWLNKLGLLPCVEDGQVETCNLRSSNIDQRLQGSKALRVRVRPSKKQLKELSALYMWQDIQAHNGSILTMKFSPDGRYLASAGEDGIVRLWQVVEDERQNDLDIPEIDSSCLYFTANHSSKLEPVDKEKLHKLRSLKKTSDSACIVFPPKIFRILEKPLHEFHGHMGEILDLSWSKNNLLLSASTDKTVRLWQVGCDQCLKTFLHNNYVTCVQFNPVNDNYFISGSIDGKVRIWAVPGCHVVDWTDVKEIVTSVCYRADGEGGVVGSITGNCRFYNVSDNRLQLDAQIALRSKKKSPGKRITGLQYLPEDSGKVMVTCADSQVRILQGSNVISKYKGVRSAESHIVASLTSDGKHIVSATEDSTVYVWNNRSQEHTTLSQLKSVKSCERFTTNASVAIPWCGLNQGISDNSSQVHVSHRNPLHPMHSPSPASFSLNQDFFLEAFPKGSATWPEEKLPKSNPLSAPSLMKRSEYQFLQKSCQSTSSSHAWGLVIVTAGWDGRIRSFHNYGLPVPT